MCQLQIKSLRKKPQWPKAEPSMLPHLLLFCPWSRIPDGNLTDNMVCVSQVVPREAMRWGLQEEKSEKQEQYPLASLLQVISLEVVLILFACWQPGSSPTKHMVCWMSSLLSLQPVTLSSHLSAWWNQGLRLLWLLCGCQCCTQLLEVKEGLQAGRAAMALLWPAPETWASQEESECLLGAQRAGLCQFIFPFQKNGSTLNYNIMLIVQQIDSLYIYIYIYIYLFSYYFPLLVIMKYWV